MDLALLQEVIAQNPYRNTERWPAVTVNVNQAIQQSRPNTPEIAQWMLKEHIQTLLKHHLSDNAAQLKKQVFTWLLVFIVIMCVVSFAQHHKDISWSRSGSDEQYAEKKKMLQDVLDLKNDVDEHARVLVLAKRVENEAKKKSC